MPDRELKSSRTIYKSKSPQSRSSFRNNKQICLPEKLNTQALKIKYNENIHTWVHTPLPWHATHESQITEKTPHLQANIAFQITRPFTQSDWLLTDVIRQIKKIPVFRVTRPYLYLLFRFSWKNIILCILKGETPFKMHKIIFSRKKYVCLPYLKFSDPLPETHFFFYLALWEFWKCRCYCFTYLRKCMYSK